MRRLILLVALLVASCGTATEPVPTTVPPTQAAATAAPTTSNTPATVGLEITDCSTPQVTFSAICEAYQLIQQWHVDGPFDPYQLAQAAVGGLVAFEPDTTEDPPRAVVCAAPDPAFAGFCEALAQLVREAGIPIGAAVEAAVASMVEESLDPFSYYVAPDQVDNFRANGVIEGVGILLDATDAAGSKCARIADNCRLEIVFVLDDNPGADAGLRDGDVIVEIDGAMVDGMGFVEAGALIAGDELGTVELTVQRGASELEFSIDRGELEIPTVQVRLVDDRTGYVKIPDFESDIPDLVVDGLLFFEDGLPRTLIIDLRDNPGGFVDSAIDVISEFVDGGLLMVENDGDDDFEYTATEGGLATEPRLIVLVNGGSASAAEVTAAALREARNAIVVGTPTFGKDAVQIAFELRNGGELYLAVGRWTSPSGISVANQGLIPDIEADLPTDLAVEDLVAQVLELTR